MVSMSNHMSGYLTSVVMPANAGIQRRGGGIPSTPGARPPCPVYDRIVRGPMPVSAEGASCSASAAGSVTGLWQA